MVGGWCACPSDWRSKCSIATEWIVTLEDVRDVVSQELTAVRVCISNNCCWESSGIEKGVPQIDWEIRCGPL